jgi:GNAT superfamily N-acetyltransferase
VKLTGPILADIYLGKITNWNASQIKSINPNCSLPDLNIALKYNRRGYLLPGFLRLMWHKKKINWMRIIVLGVVRERQKTGAASVLFYETARRAEENGYNDGEAAWVLEDNLMMNRAAEFLQAELYKKYRLYQTNL